MADLPELVSRMLQLQQQRALPPGPSPMGMLGSGGGQGMLPPGSMGMLGPGMAPTPPPASSMMGGYGAGLPGAATAAGRTFTGPLGAPAASTAGGAGLSGLAARLGGIPGNVAKAGGWGLRGPGWGPQGVAGAAKLGIAGRAGLGGMAGMLASTAIDKVVPGSNSPIEQMLQGAGIGAGVGAAVGTPFFGIGALPGAGIGALVGAGGGLLTSLMPKGKGEKPTTSADFANVLQTAMGQAALTPEDQQQILGTFTVLNTLADALPKGEQRDTAKQNALTQASSMLIERMGSAQQQKQDLAKMLALQSSAAQFMQPYNDQLMEASTLDAQMAAQMAKSMPPQFQAAYLDSARNRLTNSQKLAAAYGAQSTMIPAAMALQETARLQAQQPDPSTASAANPLMQMLQTQLAGGGQ